MDPSVEFAFGEIFRKLDELKAQMERRWAAPEERGPAIKPHAVGLEQLDGTPLVKADNWGGLFDESAPDSTSSDSSSPLPPEKEQRAFDSRIVAGNWGGEFKEPRIMEEYEYESAASGVASPSPMMEHLTLDAAATKEVEPETNPHEIQELGELQDVDIATFKMALSDRDAEMRALAAPPRIHASLFGSGSDAVFNSVLSSGCDSFGYLMPIASSAIEAIDPVENPLQIQERKEQQEVDEKILQPTLSEALKADDSAPDRICHGQDALSTPTPPWRAALRWPRFGRPWRLPPRRPRPRRRQRALLPLPRLRRQRRALPRPPRLRRPRRAPPRPPWHCLPRSLRLGGPRPASPHRRERQRRRTPPRPPRLRQLPRAPLWRVLPRPPQHQRPRRALPRRRGRARPRTRTPGARRDRLRRRRLRLRKRPRIFIASVDTSIGLVSHLRISFPELILPHVPSSSMGVEHRLCAMRAAPAMEEKTEMFPSPSEPVFPKQLFASVGVASATPMGSARLSVSRIPVGAGGCIAFGLILLHGGAPKLWHKLSVSEASALMAYAVTAYAEAQHHFPRPYKAMVCKRKSELWTWDAEAERATELDRATIPELDAAQLVALDILFAASMETIFDPAANPADPGRPPPTLPSRCSTPGRNLVIFFHEEAAARVHRVQGEPVVVGAFVFDPGDADPERTDTVYAFVAEAETVVPGSVRPSWELGDKESKLLGILLSTEEKMDSTCLFYYKAPVAILLLVPAMECHTFGKVEHLVLEDPSFLWFLPCCIPCLRCPPSVRYKAPTTSLLWLSEPVPLWPSCRIDQDVLVSVDTAIHFVLVFDPGVLASVRSSPSPSSSPPREGRASASSATTARMPFPRSHSRASPASSTPTSTPSSSSPPTLHSSALILSAPLLETNFAPARFFFRVKGQKAPVIALSKDKASSQHFGVGNTRSYSSRSPAHKRKETQRTLRQGARHQKQRTNTTKLNKTPKAVMSRGE